MPRPASVVITGGASLIHRGLRGQTEDIDIAYEVAAGDDARMTTAIRELKDALSINIELAEPGQFIPMPRGRESRRTFVARYGSVDVFLDDPYAVALSKLARGLDRDLEDVRLLADAKLIDFADLEAKAREIADPATPRSARVDLPRMLARLAAIRGA